MAHPLSKIQHISKFPLSLHLDVRLIRNSECINLFCLHHQYQYMLRAQVLQSSCSGLKDQQKVLVGQWPDGDFSLCSLRVAA